MKVLQGQLKEVLLIWVASKEPQNIKKTLNPFTLAQLVSHKLIDLAFHLQRQINVDDTKILIFTQEVECYLYWI